MKRKGQKAKHNFGRVPMPSKPPKVQVPDTVYNRKKEQK